MLVLARALLLIVEGVRVVEQHNVHKTKPKASDIEFYNYYTRPGSQERATKNWILFVLFWYLELSWAVTIIFFFLLSPSFLKCLLNLKWCCLLKYTNSVLLMCICKRLCFEMYLQIYKSFTTHTTCHLTTDETPVFNNINLRITCDVFNHVFHAYFILTLIKLTDLLVQNIFKNLCSARHYTDFEVLMCKIVHEVCIYQSIFTYLFSFYGLYAACNWDVDRVAKQQRGWREEWA